MKVAFLVPSTSKNRTWEEFTDTYLCQYLIQSVLRTKQDDFDYTFYLGFDSSEKLYTSENFLMDMRKVFEGVNKVSFKITVFDETIKAGHLTKMWNILFNTAFNDGCDYFFQCGDDVELIDKGWVSECISLLKSNDDYGMTGPNDIDYPRILTQTFVSRKHKIIFDLFFPEEITNWYCDDWINFVYRRLGKAYKAQCRCINRGGSQRYEIADRNGVPNFDLIVSNSVELFKKKIDFDKAQS